MAQDDGISRSEKADFVLGVMILGIICTRNLDIEEWYENISHSN